MIERVSHLVRFSLYGLALTTFDSLSCSSLRTAGENSAIRPEMRTDAAMGLHQQHVRRAARGGIDLLFLGDSITQSWNENPVWMRYYAPRNAANFGIGGDRTQHLLWRIDHGATQGFEPKVAVVLIGTNNLDANSPEETAAGIQAVVDRLLSRWRETRILLLGVFPRGRTRDDRLESDDPLPEVDRLNALIAPLGDHPRVTFLDLTPSFLDASGRIPRELMPDFLHLSRKGYRVWAEAMEPTLWRLLEGAGGRPSEGRSSP